MRNSTDVVMVRTRRRRRCHQDLLSGEVGFSKLSGNLNTQLGSILFISMKILLSKVTDLTDLPARSEMRVLSLRKDRICNLRIKSREESVDWDRLLILGGCLVMLMC